MVNRYMTNPNAYLHVIDEGLLEFEMLSQTKEDKWYGLSLSECCDCLDHVSICKYMMALKTIVDQKFQHLISSFGKYYSILKPH
jgi:hypothetical protein